MEALWYRQRFSQAHPPTYSSRIAILLIMSSSLAPTPTASEVPLYIPGLDGTFSGEFRSMTFEGARPISTQGAGDDAATVYEVMNKVHASTLGVDLKTSE